jgi:hypothetical protein
VVKHQLHNDIIGGVRMVRARVSNPLGSRSSGTFAILVVSR